MKLYQQLLLSLAGLGAAHAPPTPATVAAAPGRAKRPSLKGPDDHLTGTARDLVSALRGHKPLADRVRVVWNPRLQTTAGTANPRTWEVELNPRLKELQPQTLHRILRHELAHLVSVFRAGRRRIDAHGPEWRQACADLGIPGEPRCHQLPFKSRKVRHKHAYRCMHCGHLLKRVKPLPRFSACYQCCHQFNHGQYDERYRYVTVPIDVVLDETTPSTPSNHHAPLTGRK